MVSSGELASGGRSHADCTAPSAASERPGLLSRVHRHATPRALGGAGQGGRHWISAVVTEVSCRAAATLRSAAGPPRLSIFQTSCEAKQQAEHVDIGEVLVEDLLSARDCEHLGLQPPSHRVAASIT